MPTLVKRSSLVSSLVKCSSLLETPSHERQESCFAAVWASFCPGTLTPLLSHQEFLEHPSRSLECRLNAFLATLSYRSQEHSLEQPERNRTKYKAVVPGRAVTILHCFGSRRHVGWTSRGSCASWGLCHFICEVGA